MTPPPSNARTASDHRIDTRTAIEETVGHSTEEFGTEGESIRSGPPEGASCEVTLQSALKGFDRAQAPPPNVARGPNRATTLSRTGLAGNPENDYVAG